MRRVATLTLISLLLCAMLSAAAAQADEEATSALAACKDFAFSTEEDFVTNGPVPADGNPIISDGDLLGRNSVCARNAELLAPWKLQVDLGLDAVDVIDVERRLVAFSTELDHPTNLFKSGDLLATNGLVIPNKVLLTKFQVGRDLGLDGLQFIGDPRMIVSFLEEAAKISRDEWLRDPSRLFALLSGYRVDIWISTEGTELRAATTQILDGDILSVANGVIVVHQADLLPPFVPAGIPARGVDFGVDAIAASRRGDRATIRFSTEILYRGEMSFTDGDILRQGDGIQETNASLVKPFEPKARFLGLDALYINLDPTISFDDYLPLIRNRAR